MLEDLKLGDRYDGFLFLAEATRNLPTLKSHHHVELELNLVARGTLSYVVGGERYSYGAGSLLWLYPSQEHQLVERSRDAQYYVAVFKPEAVARWCRLERYRALRRKRPRQSGVEAVVLSGPAYDELRHLMDRVMEGSMDPDVLNREAGFGISPSFRFSHDDADSLNAGLHHLLITAWKLTDRGLQPGRPTSLHPGISKALTVLAREDGSETLAELAGACGLSPAHFSRLFKRQLGVPLNHYRSSLKLERFWARWNAPVRPTMLEAAFGAGFGSYAQFSKVFRAAYGEGPRRVVQRGG